MKRQITPKGFNKSTPLTRRLGCVHTVPGGIRIPLIEYIKRSPRSIVMIHAGTNIADSLNPSGVNFGPLSTPGFTQSYSYSISPGFKITQSYSYSSPPGFKITQSYSYSISPGFKITQSYSYSSPPGFAASIAESRRDDLMVAKSGSNGSVPRTK